MAVWTVRAGRNGEREDLALDQGLVVIGWEEIPDLAQIASRDELDALCRRTYPDEKPNTITTWVGQLWAFRDRMQPGELVLLPRKRPGASGTVAIGRVTGPYQYRPDLPPDAFHMHPVEWLRIDVPRSAFDDDILYSLGSLLTVFQIQREHVEQRIRALLSGRASAASGPQPRADGDAVVDVQAPTDLEAFARDRIRTHIDQRFRGHDLARLVDAILSAQGYQTLNSAPGPDGGVDIIAGQGPLGFDPPRMCVQVKSTAQPIDVRPIRELQGVLNTFNAQYGLFVSWGGFTQPALNHARQHYFNLRLWDADSLLDALLANYDRLPADLQAELPLKRIWTLVLEE